MTGDFLDFGNRCSRTLRLNLLKKRENEGKGAKTAEAKRHFGSPYDLGPRGQGGMCFQRQTRLELKIFQAIGDLEERVTLSLLISCVGLGDIGVNFVRFFVVCLHLLFLIIILLSIQYST